MDILASFFNSLKPMGNLFCEKFVESMGGNMGNAASEEAVKAIVLNPKQMMMKTMTDTQNSAMTDVANKGIAVFSNLIAGTASYFGFHAMSSACDENNAKFQEACEGSFESLYCFFTKATEGITCGGMGIMASLGLYSGFNVATTAASN